MRRRRLARVVGVGNIAVLALALSVVAAEGDRPQGVGANAATRPAASDPALPDGAGVVPATGSAEREPADPTARRVDLPQHELGQLPHVPRAGVLAGDPDQEGGCVWIELEGEPNAVLWPPGYQAGFGGSGDELELIDEAGGVVARGGEAIWFTGARSGVAERLDRCHVGEDAVWYVGRVGTDAAELDD